MGQKTHPLGFRLGIVKDHKSKWYANFDQYSIILQEDYQIRNYINTVAKLNSISNILIERNSINNQIKVYIETGEPGIVMGKEGIGLKNLLKNIKKFLTRLVP